MHSAVNQKRTYKRLVSEQESIMDLALAVSIPTSVLTICGDMHRNNEPEELLTHLESINSFDTTVLQVILNDEMPKNLQVRCLGASVAL